MLLDRTACQGLAEKASRTHRGKREGVAWALAADGVPGLAEKA
jgi:hypothetical protein